MCDACAAGCPLSPNVSRRVETTPSPPNTSMSEETYPPTRITTVLTFRRDRVHHRPPLRACHLGAAHVQRRDLGVVLVLVIHFVASLPPAVPARTRPAPPPNSPCEISHPAPAPAPVGTAPTPAREQPAPPPAASSPPASSPATATPRPRPAAAPPARGSPTRAATARPTAAAPLGGLTPRAGPQRHLLRAYQPSVPVVSDEILGALKRAGPRPAEPPAADGQTTWSLVAPPPGRARVRMNFVY